MGQHTLLLIHKSKPNAKGVCRFCGFSPGFLLECKTPKARKRRGKPIPGHDILVQHIRRLCALAAFAPSDMSPEDAIEEAQAAIYKN